MWRFLSRGLEIFSNLGIFIPGIFANCGDFLGIFGDGDFSGMKIFFVG